MKKENKKKLLEQVPKLHETLIVIEEVLSEEQDLFDEHSAEWQESAKGEEAQELIEEVDSVKNNLEDAIESLESLP